MSSRNSYEQVETGIYKYNHNDGTVSYHERPGINGKRSYRSLGFGFTRQTSLKNARVEYQRRRVEVAAGRNPYADQQPKPEAEEKAEITIGDVIRKYQSDDYPNKYRQDRTEKNRNDEERHCETLLKHWDQIPVSKAGPAECDRYHDWRLKNHKLGKGSRATDRELNTLNNACRWGARTELITVNPVVDRPKYQPSTEVRHCREFMPRSADELHEAAALFFKHPNSVVLGFQMIEEAYTGLRTCEVLQWGNDHYGTITGEFVRVWRCKGQDGNNPYVKFHSGLKAVLEAHMAWKAVNYPNEETFFPSYWGGRIDQMIIV
jgi:hypothetical protein